MPQRGVNDADRAFEFRHRNPTALEYVVVSKIVLIGYPNLSDSAKVTYWVIYSHDWVDPATGARKGYAYPSLKRLGALRHATERTIRRHLAELIGGSLITRELRPGKPSLLYIEEPAGEGLNDYLRSQERGADKNVRPPRTKMSGHKKEEIEQEKTVNGGEKRVMEEDSPKRVSELHSVAELLRKRKPASAADRTSWLAEEMLRLTGDLENRGCYRVVAERCPEQVIFEALALLRDAGKTGGIRNRGAWFVSQLRRLCQERHLADPFHSLSFDRRERP